MIRITNKKHPSVVIELPEDEWTIELPDVIPTPVEEPKAKVTYDDDFEAWWQQVPKKQGKLAARDAYNSRRKEGVLADVLLNAMIAYTKKCTVEKTEPKYIKDPSGWLNKKEERWKWDYTPAINKRPFKSTYNIAKDEQAAMHRRGQEKAATIPQLVADIARQFRI